MTYRVSYTTTVGEVGHTIAFEGPFLDDIEDRLRAWIERENLVPWSQQKPEEGK